jgi:Adenine specific DNA methylase Mod
MTELIWEGKYDNDGKKTAPIKIALPFQTIETVNESAQQRQITLDMFASGKPTEWRNRLIWGDKKYVLPSLLAEFAGKINLIYIDPPFDTGSNFSYQSTIPNNPETSEDESTIFIKEPSIIEQKAYRDTWGKNRKDSYSKWFYETVILLRELLSDNGSIYVHVDWHMSHYVKLIMDEVFGFENFQNEIVWRRQTSSSSKARAKSLGKIMIHFYTILNHVNLLLINSTLSQS